MGDVQKLFNRIKEEELTPRPSWHFSSMNRLAWVAYALFIMIGAIAISVILFAIQQADFSLVDHMKHSSTELLLSLIPLIWLGFMIIFLILSIFMVSGTRKGYKFPVLSLITINFLLSLMIASLVFISGGAQFLEKQFADTVTSYQSVQERKIEIWSNPEEGTLSGTIIRVQDFNIQIMDFEKQEWSVALADSSFIANAVQLEAGESIKMTGTKTGNFEFTADGVRPWGRGPHLKNGKNQTKK